MSKPTLYQAAKILLIAIKNQELTIFPANENTPDYIQMLEDAAKEEPKFIQQVGRVTRIKNNKT